MNENYVLKKKIYLVEINGHEILDLTIETIDIVKSSNYILVDDRFNKKFINDLQFLNKTSSLKIVKNEEEFKKVTLELFKKNNSIIYFFSNLTPFISSLNSKISFFEQKKIHCFFLNQTLEILNIFNKSNFSLTDRRKNSTLDFFQISKISDIAFLIKKSNKEKVIFVLNNTILFKSKDLEELNRNNNFKISFVTNKNKLLSLNKNLTKKTYLKYFIFELNE